jgi:hypothetical protein
MRNRKRPSVFVLIYGVIPPAFLADAVQDLLVQLGRAWRKVGHDRKEIEEALWRMGHAVRSGLEGDCEEIPGSRHLSPGWGCCQCHTYNGETRATCKACSHRRCSIVPDFPATTRRATARDDGSHHCGGVRCGRARSERGPCGCLCWPCVVVNLTSGGPMDPPAQGSPEGSQEPGGGVA